MTERVFTILLILGGALFAYYGLLIQVPFAYDPLGPKAFPVFLGIFLVVLNIPTLFSADTGTRVFKGNVGRLALTILVYFFTFQFLGFMLSTTIAVYNIARLRGCSWMEGLLTGLVISICFYGVFHFLLRVPLPLGFIFKVIG